MEKKIEMGFDLRKLPVGTEFDVVNGAWSGKIAEYEERLLCIYVNATGRYIPITEDNCYGYILENIKYPEKQKDFYSNKYITEPLILEPEDWSENEWATILKLFGMKSAERIKISNYKLEAFGIKK